MNKILVGSRESLLAVAQSNIIINEIKNKYPNIKIEIVKIKTTGDIILDRTLDKVGGKGLFVKELDNYLLNGNTDISIHSLKDVPMDISEKLPIIAFSKRGDPRDALVLPLGISEIDKSKPIGCSSKRRIYQLKKIFPEFSFKVLRGNIITRLNKLDNLEYSAIILAAAGLKRVSLEHRISRIFSVDEVVPACGQGILAIQGEISKNYDFLKFLDNEESRYCALAERAFVKELNGGCSMPIGSYAYIQNEQLFLTGLYFNESGTFSKFVKSSGHYLLAEEIGTNLAKSIEIIN